jgi:hypothetical protein
MSTEVTITVRGPGVVRCWIATLLMKAAAWILARGFRVDA